MNEIADFGQLKEWTPYSGDGAQVLLPFDGDIKGKIDKIKKGKSSTTGNLTLKIVMHVAETGLGGTLYKDIPYTGTRRDDKSNMVGVADFLLSVGWTAEQIQGFAAKDEKVAIDSLIAQVLKGNGDVFMTVEADVYNGRESSKVTNFITQARYDEQVRKGNARRPRAGAAAASNGAGTAANSATSTGPDPLAGMM